VTEAVFRAMQHIFTGKAQARLKTFSTNSAKLESENIVIEFDGYGGMIAGQTGRLLGIAHNTPRMGMGL